MKKILFLFLATSILFTYSCSDNSNDDPTDPNPPTPTTQIMNISVNGVDYVITEFENSLLIVDYGVYIGRRLDLRFDLDSIPTTIVVSNFSFQNPPAEGIIEKAYETNFEGDTSPTQECSSSGGITYCDGGAAFYDAGFYTYTTIEEQEGDQHVTITDCNPISHKVSGEFDFMLTFSGLPDTLHCVGTFENLEYVVYQ